MSTRDHGQQVRSIAVPAACVVFAGAYLAIGITHHRVLWGVLTAGVVLAVGIAAAVARHRKSDAAVLLSGEPMDERYLRLESQSLALTGRVLIIVVTAGMFWSLAADNRYQGMFIALAAIGGWTLILAQWWNSRHG